MYNINYTKRCLIEITKVGDSYTLTTDCSSTIFDDYKVETIFGRRFIALTFEGKYVYKIIHYDKFDEFIQKLENAKGE